MFFFKVLVANSFCSKPYTYYYDHDLAINTVICVSFGRKICTGIIVSVANEMKEAKKIIQIYNYQLNLTFMDFIKKFADYYFIKIGAVLELVFPSISFKKAMPILLIFENKKQILSRLLKKLALKDIKKLIPATNQFEYKSINFLSDDQKEAIHHILNSKNVVSVLEGSTGSGKTIVSLSIAMNIMNQQCFKSKILILVPEINLSNNWEETIQKEFDIIPYVYHSKMSQSFKKSFFNWAISNDPGIIIGTRSSLAIPYVNLGYIIVDEEHARSYRQDFYPYYQARDMAVLLASCLNIKILLITATPSLETVFNINIKKYDHFKLSRQPKHGLATINYVKGMFSEIISQSIIEKILDRFKKNEQVLLFLNRKGYAPYCYCNNCKNLLLCPSCDSSLTLYFGYKVVCHKCLKKNFLPKTCPYCSALTTWSFWGLGVEKLYEFLSNKLPDYSFSVITCDSEDIDSKLLEIKDNKVNGIIATQILAQGHDFKNIGLVVVVDADMGLVSTDFRAMEYMYQLWQQIRGRSGRHDVKGEMILQYFKKENKFLELFKKNNINEFLLEERKKENWPPFSKCALVKFKGKNQERLQKEVDSINFQSENIFGPLYFGLINNVFEYRFLIKEKKYSELKLKLEKIKTIYPKCEIEVDPY